MQYNSYSCHPFFKTQKLTQLLMRLQDAVIWNTDSRLVDVNLIFDEAGLSISVIESITDLPIYTIIVSFEEKLNMSRILIPASKTKYKNTNNQVNGINQKLIDSEVDQIIDAQATKSEFQWYWATPFDDLVQEIHFASLQTHVQIIKHKQSSTIQKLISPFQFLKKVFYRQNRVTGFGRDEIINRINNR